MITRRTDLRAQPVLDMLASHAYSREVLRANSTAFRDALPANTQVVVATMPFTRATCLSRAIAAITGRRWSAGSYAGDDANADLYFPALARDCINERAVCELPLQPTQPNLELLRAFNLQPIVQVTDIFDAVAAAAEALPRDPARRVAEPDLTRHLGTLPPAERVDAVIDLFLPEMLGFYRGWWEAERSGLKVMWVDAAELEQDGLGVVRLALDFLGLQPAPTRLERVMSSLARHRAAEPAAAELTNGHRDRIRRVAARFPWVDFGRLGIVRI